MNENKPIIYTQNNALICDWTDEKDYLDHYRMLKFCIRRGWAVDKFHGVISFRQSEWLVRFIKFETQNRNLAKNGFEKNFYKLENIAFYGQTMKKN